MFEQFRETVNRNEYIGYLQFLNIDTTEIIDNIRLQVETQKDDFDTFTNRIHKMWSPNILLENIIFEEVNKYLYKNNYDLDIFKRNIELDMKTLIATQNSLIQRPQTSNPSKTTEGFKTNLENENGFIRIARFENEMIKDSKDWKIEGQTIVFEGLSIFGEETPLFEDLPSSLIWDNALYYPNYPFIIGWVRKFNTIESNNTLWLNSLLQHDLGLILDDFNNGLQAFNEKGEIVLKFRQWRSKLIGNGSSFVGQDSNIPQFEGCDLILREDYFEKLKRIVPKMRFYTKKLELKQ
jgi:hypothetical protein